MDKRFWLEPLFWKCMAIAAVIGFAYFSLPDLVRHTLSGCAAVWFIGTFSARVAIALEEFKRG